MPKFALYLEEPKILKKGWYELKLVKVSHKLKKDVIFILKLGDK